MTICVQGGSIEVTGTQITVDAGVWWDDVVKTAINHSLWGVELLGEIPGSVGGAAFINIAAYGQSFGNCVEWIEVWDRQASQVKKLLKNDLGWGYKNSVFQRSSDQEYVIMRVCLNLATKKTTELSYQKALDVAAELQLNSNSLSDRRKIIHETRERAGSLWSPNGKQQHHTAGSFFRNPIVSVEIAEKLMSFDESGKSIQELRSMNKVHGGDERRVSAAHVLLAAGFNRGQQWKSVKLNDQNVLKIEALAGATAQDIYNVMTEIQQTCNEKLGIKLEPEARILGTFS